MVRTTQKQCIFCTNRSANYFIGFNILFNMALVKAEKDILREILEYLDKKQYFFWRSNNIPVFGKNNAGKMTFRSMPKYTPKGIPDIIIIKDGRFIGIEVKREKAKLKPEQEAFAARLTENGAYYHVARSVEEVDVILSRYEPLN